MASVLDEFRKQSQRRRRRLRRVEQSHQRLDIQGLRMVAVLTVFACHLWGWPRGGFIGVDVFFVISGFLITGNLLRMAESAGNVSFKRFYWNRVRRIVPAATVVLVLTYLASTVVFQPFRADQVGIDALFAFTFVSNWWFAVQGTDYFAAGDAVSPIQHYWSLSVEEQFYFLWPALIFTICLLVARKAWTHNRRMQLVGAGMAGIIAASLGWAWYETTESPTWAYFNTFSRVWELGVGALLATAVGALARIPTKAKPWLSWAGLVIITASVFLISENSVGFPAPWALLPVTGAAMVIAAGVAGEPTRQGFLRNPASVYIGNISYSLYLVHWPLIVILGTLMPKGALFYLATVAFSFGLAIASLHFVENPLRHVDWEKARDAVHQIRRRRYRPEQASQYAALAALILVVVGLAAFGYRPTEPHQLPPNVGVASPEGVGASETDPEFGPLTSALQGEILQALNATEWPQLDPSMESVFKDRDAPPEVYACGVASVDPIDDAQACTWGSPSAPTRVVVVGDSIAVSYGGPLRELALQSGGQIQVHVAAMNGCEFVDAPIYFLDESNVDACRGRAQRQVDLINSVKPDVVIISNFYSTKRIAGSEQPLTTGEWSNLLSQMIDKFRANTKKVVLLSAPPADKNVVECFSDRSNVPADCIGRVNEAWLSMARDEQNLAALVGGTWIDSQPWFCIDGDCPSFVGSIPVKRDAYHMSLAYGQKIYPAIGESFRAAGVF